MPKLPIIFSLFVMGCALFYSCATSKNNTNNAENASAKTQQNDSSQIGLEYSVEEKLLEKYKKKTDVD